MSIRAVPRRLVSLAVAAVTLASVATLSFAASASASGPADGSQVPNSATPNGTSYTAGIPFGSGQTIRIQVPANSTLTPGARIDIIECSDPGGLTANDPTSVADCDENTIQGDTVIANSDGSVTYGNYQVYALPDSHLGEMAGGTPVCNATNYCVLYIGQNQENFSGAPYVLSQPFLVSSNASDNGANPGNGAPLGTPFDVVGVPIHVIVPVAGAPNGAPTSTKGKKLPKGLSVSGNSNGTATITGTGTKSGTSSSTIQETFGSGHTKQVFSTTITITVFEAPTFQSAPTSDTVTLGKHGKHLSVKFKTDKKENPSPPTFTESGILPSGVSWTVVNGTELELVGTLPTGSDGTYPFTVEASNGYGSPATANFTLTVTG